MRLIIIVIAIALVFFVLKKSVSRLLYSSSKSKARPNEAMLPCDYCQVHIPESEAVRHGENHFCKDEHLQTWLKEKTNQ